MNRAYSLFEVKSLDAERRTFKGIATTPSPDRVGDIVEPLGATFKNPLPLLWQHDHSKPIGTVRFSQPTAKGIEFEAEIASVSDAGSLKDRLDEAWQSIKAGLVRAVSIGFRPIAHEPLQGGGLRFTKSEIFELSAVTIPANEQATISLAKSLDAPFLAASGNEEDKQDLSAGVSAKSLSTQDTKPKMNKTFAESRAEFETKRAANLDRMDELLSKSADEGKTLSADEDAEYDRLEAECKSLDKDIERLKTREAAAVSKATRVEGVKTAADAGRVRDGVSVKVGADQLPAGVEFARFVKSLAIANGDPMRALEVAKSAYPSSDRIHTVLKAAIPAGGTVDPAWAGSLTEYGTFAGDFISFLRPTTILGKFGQNGIPGLVSIPFNVKIPRQISGGSAYWVGEGAASPLTRFDFDNIELGHAKLSATAALTNDLIRFSSPSADLLVRDGLAAALREKLDLSFIDPTVTEIARVRPAAITNGATTIASTGDIEADIDAAMLAFITANLSTASGVWIMSEVLGQRISRIKNPLGQREYPEIGPKGGILAGLPVITSQYVPAGLIALVATSEVYLADDGQVTVNASREASLEMRDDPTNNSLTPTAAQMVSMFQTDSTAIKVVRHVNYERRRPEGVVVITGATYAPEVPGGE